MKRRAELLLAAGLLLAGCGEDPIPKPRGYFRIDMPEPRFAAWSDTGVVWMEVPEAARIALRQRRGEARWYDLRYSALRGTVHLTWSPVNGDLSRLIEDAHIFKRTHQSKAARIDSERLLRPEDRVFGTLFKVEGDVASPFVFYLTDSTDNFLYGALYFDVPPNADSLAPVTERVRADMHHLATTLRWQ
jgi:gliding motility-associated lipoprotein GldD